MTEDPTSTRVVSETAVVDAPPATVFAILADPRQHPRIDGSGTLKGTIRGPEHLTKGDTFGMDMKMFGLPYTIKNTVVEYEPDARIAWRHFAGHRWRYELEALSQGGTRVTESFDYSRVPGLQARLLEVAGFPRKNRAGIRATLTRLADAARSDA